MTQREFDLKQDLRIVRLSSTDARSDSDHMRALRGLLAEAQPMYPMIDCWTRDKVIPGLRSGERAAFIGYIGETPSVSAVVRKGMSAKFCHLKVASALQDKWLGDLFFTLMALETRSFANSVHFTLPEGLWEEKRGFFESFGFSKALPAGNQYRSFERELSCGASFDVVWRAATRKLPQLLAAYSVQGATKSAGLLLSVRPRFAEAILDGRKTVELRKKFSSRWIGQRMAIYASSPQCCLLGDAKIANVREAAPEEIWAHYSDRVGASREIFDAYAAGSKTLSAVELVDVRPYARPMPFKEAQKLAGTAIRPPQSHCSLGEEGWGVAVSLSSWITTLPAAILAS